MKEKLAKFMAKVKENRNILISAAGAATLSALFLAENIGLFSAMLLALSGILSGLAQVTDPDENLKVTLGGTLLMSSFLINYIFGSTVMVLSLLGAAILFVFGSKK